MNGFGLSFDTFKKSFFTPDVLTKAVQKTLRGKLSRLGAFVRRRAQTSLRYRKKPSRPGQPPSAHKGATRIKTNKKTGVTKMTAVSLLREFILFAYQANEQSVIIGPALINGPRRNRGSQTVPELLEYGGTTTIETLETPNPAQTGKQRASLKQKKQRTAHYPARPYMRPALEAELPKFMESLKDSV